MIALSIDKYPECRTNNRYSRIAVVGFGYRKTQPSPAHISLHARPSRCRFNGAQDEEDVEEREVQE